MTKDHMSAEERASEVAGWVEGPMAPNLREAIANAIKAAENDALERAAKDFQDWADGSLYATVNVLQIIQRLRSLQSKDTP